MTAITLQNNYLQATIVPLGAELKSLLLRDSNRELMWQGDPQVWGRTSPVLFPAVGKSIGDAILINGKSYPLLQHGFARDMEFRLHHAGAAQCSWILDESALTAPYYPFKFSLEIAYSLHHTTLTCTYTVCNTDGQPIWFSLGAHPGFALPKEGYARYSLHFEQAETAARHLISGGLQTGETIPVLDNTQELKLQKDSFIGDALIFKNLASKGVSLTGEGLHLKMQWDNFPYLGIWGKNEPQRFICIEPWQGITENQGSTGEFSAREGIIKLEAGAEFTAWWSVSAD